MNHRRPLITTSNGAEEPRRPQAGRRTAPLPLLLLLVPAACGEPDPGTSPDAGDVDPPIGEALDRCGDDGVALEVAWDVDNLHRDLVAMAIASDGTVLLASADGAVKQWSLGTSVETAPLEGGRPSYGDPLTQEGDTVRALSVSADGTRVLGADAGGMLRHWTLPQVTSVAQRSIGKSPLTAIADVGGGGAIVADETFGGSMRVVALAEGFGGDVFTTTLWGVTTILADDNDLFTAGHNYGMAAVERRFTAFPNQPDDAWDTLSVTGWVRALAHSTDRRLAVGGDGYVVVLASDDLAAGPIGQLEGMARSVAWTQSGAHLAVATDGRVSLWDRDLTEEVAGVDLADPIALAVDPSGERLVVATSDGHLRALVCR